MGTLFTSELKILKEMIRRTRSKRKRHELYDCIVGVSGGKDSTRQAHWVRDRLGLNPLLVCCGYPPLQMTDIGAFNMSNLISMGFDVEIFTHPHNKNVGKKPCKTISHKDFLLDIKYSILRNTFFDLYPSDVEIHDLKKHRGSDFNQIYVFFTNPHTKKKDKIFYIWKEKHLVYVGLRPVSNNKNIRLKSVIPNSVYDNISIYCKK